MSVPIPARKKRCEASLGHFQAALAIENDTLKLVHSINETVKISGGRAVPEKTVDSAFNKWWSELDQTLQAIPLDTGVPEKQRTEREMLEEILEISRSLARSSPLFVETMVSRVAEIQKNSKLHKKKAGYRKKSCKER